MAEKLIGNAEDCLRENWSQLRKKNEENESQLKIKWKKKLIAIQKKMKIWRYKKFGIDSC
jgi:hypothetical protein